MSLETGDLISLLKRARQSAAAATAAAAPTPFPVPSAPEPTPKPPAAVVVEEPPPAPIAQPVHPPTAAELAVEAEELASLHIDLYADEIFLQRILGLLYRCKRRNPNGGFISILDMERTLNVEREGATFVMSYMKTHRLIEMDDKSRMAITVPGIDYLRRVLGIASAPAQQQQQPAEPED